MQLSRDISSLKEIVGTKDPEKDRLNDIDERFSNDFSNLLQLTAQIESYVDSRSGNDLKEKISNLAQWTHEKQAELTKLEANLDQLNKAIDDQLRPKSLQENIDVLAAGEKIKNLKKALSRLKKDIRQMEGSDTYVQGLNQCQTRLSELLESQARHEGRQSAILDNIQGLEVRSRAGTTPY